MSKKIKLQIPICVICTILLIVGIILILIGSSNTVVINKSMDNDKLYKATVTEVSPKEKTTTVKYESNNKEVQYTEGKYVKDIKKGDKVNIYINDKVNILELENAYSNTLINKGKICLYISAIILLISYILLTFNRRRKEEVQIGRKYR